MGGHLEIMKIMKVLKWGGKFEFGSWVLTSGMTLHQLMKHCFEVYTFVR